MPQPTVTREQLAKLFDITERHVNRLTLEGVLARAKDDNGATIRGRFPLLDNVRAYCKYLRTQARLDDASESKYVMLRNQRMACMGEEAALRLAVLKGKLHRAEDVEFVMTTRDSAIRARLLAMPSRVTRLLVGKTDPNEIRAILNAELFAILEELEAYDPRTFNERNEQYLATLFPAEAFAGSNGEGTDEDGGADIEG